jgi:hypothetical protein
MEHLIYKDSRGASQADAHYLEFGHKIVVTNEWNTRGDKLEKLKHYKCTQCKFTSCAGELIKKD